MQLFCISHPLAFRHNSIHFHLEMKTYSVFVKFAGVDPPRFRNQASNLGEIEMSRPLVRTTMQQPSLLMAVLLGTGHGRFA